MTKILKRILLSLLVILLLLFAIILGLGYKEYKDKTKEQPIEEVVHELRNNEHYVKLDEMSTYLSQAVVAIEDKRFYSHNGIDYIGTARGVIVTLSGEGRQGGSTLTQQLAKRFYYSDDNSGIKKVSEMFIAKQLEQKYSKDEILEMYINIVYYGDNFYGIYEASHGYFGIEPKTLSLAQASLLAGMPQAPSVYALNNKDERTYQRQKQVLTVMLEQEMITQAEYNQALNEDLGY